MVKTQVQMERDDLAALRRMAARMGVSVSEIVRRAVKAALCDDLEPDEAERWRRALSVAGKFRSRHTDIARRHDDHLAEIFAR